MLPLTLGNDSVGFRRTHPLCMQDRRSLRRSLRPNEHQAIRLHVCPSHPAPHQFVGPRRNTRGRRRLRRITAWEDSECHAMTSVSTRLHVLDADARLCPAESPALVVVALQLTSSDGVARPHTAIGRRANGRCSWLRKTSRELSIPFKCKRATPESLLFWLSELSDLMRRILPKTCRGATGVQLLSLMAYAVEGLRGMICDSPRGRGVPRWRLCLLGCLSTLSAAAGVTRQSLLPP